MTLVIDLAAWVLRIVLVVVAGLVPVMRVEVVAPVEPVAPIAATAEVAAEVAPIVHEDSPDWDCATMGNRICGPSDNAPATIENVVACAQSLGGLSDGNLAHCADSLGLACGLDPRVDSKRSDC